MQKPMGLMISGMNYANAPEEEFNDWYDLEHIPQRLAIPGFINAPTVARVRRFDDFRRDL